MSHRLTLLLTTFALLTTGCTLGVADAEEPVDPAIVLPTADTSVLTQPSVPATIATTTEPPTPATSTSTTEPEVSTETLAAHETLAARSDHDLAVYARPLPIEPHLVLESKTILGTPRVVKVLEGPVDGWLRVSLPVRPNGSEGWVKADGLVLFVVDRRVEVDLSDRTLTVSDGAGVLLETAVAVGSSSSPTPAGNFYVTDSVITGNDNGPWGPWAFGLSARSDVITEFNGGDGIIGIHGTNRPSSIGSAASLGCVRVPNEVALELGGLISAGIPVEIRP